MFLARYPGAEGVVTVDADGQHLAADVVRVAESFLATPDALVIGRGNSRGARPGAAGSATSSPAGCSAGWPGGGSPTHNRGCAASARRSPRGCSELAGERYEYEMNVLAACPRLPVPSGRRDRGGLPRRQPLVALQPVVDSVKIYSLLLGFSLSPLSARVRR